MKNRLIPFCFFLAFSHSLLFMQRADAKPKEQETFGKISGYVIKENGGKGLAAARLYFNTINREIYTDPEGEFALDNVPPGTYKVSLFASEMGAPRTFSCLVKAGYVAELKISIRDEGAINVHAAYSGLPAGTLAGRVLMQTGFCPVGGAKIVVEGRSEQTSADSSGNFIIDGLAAGTYTISAIVDQCPVTTMRNVTIDAGGIKTIDIVEGLSGGERPRKAAAGETGTIVGQLYDNDGIPVAANNLMLGQTGIRTLTDEQGFFRFSGIAAGAYALSLPVGNENFWKSLSGVVVVPAMVTNLKIVLKESGPSVTALTITSWAPGVAAGFVRNRADGTALGGALIVLGDSLSVRADSAGQFALSDLLPGVYRLIVTLPDFETFTAKLSIYEGKTTERDVELTPRVRRVALAVTVRDSLLQRAIAGAALEIDGEAAAVGDSSGMAAATLRAGFTHSITVRAKGYAPTRIDSLVPTGEDTLRLTINLVQVGAEQEGSAAMSGEAVSDLGKTTISSTMIRNSEAGLLAERRRTMVVADGISGAEISRAGAGNAADAVKKVPGVTIIGGKYVYIRGMGERYVNVSLNDQALPSPDPDKRAFPLDLLPTGLIDNIVTNKSYTPDRPGDFAGGNVNIQTRSIPEKFLFNVSVKSGANTQIAGKDILDYQGGSLDWLGFDDGTRTVPAEVDGKTIEIPSYSMANTDTALATTLNNASHAFNDKFYLDTVRAMPDLGFGISTGNKFDALGVKWGGLLSLSYSNKTKGYSDGVNGRYEAGQNATVSSILAPEQLRSDQKYTNEVLWGGLATAGVEFSPQHKINTALMYIQNAENTTQVLYGSVTHIDHLESRFFHFAERNLTDVQINGTHELNTTIPLTVAWRGSRAQTYQNEPDERFYIMEHRIDTTAVTYAFPSTQKPPTRYYRNLDETSDQYYADLTFHLDGTTEENKIFKAGVCWQGKQRDYRQQYFTFYSQSDESNIAVFNGDARQYFNAANAGLLSDTVIIRYNRTSRKWDTTLVNTWGVVVSPMSLVADYSTQKTVPALYGMLAYDFFETLKIVGGVRYEQTNYKLDMIDTSLSDNTTVSDDWLPALSLQFSPTSSTTLRCAYGRTLARPSDREIVPVAAYNVVTNADEIGNDSLRQMSIDNLDLRGEWYPVLSNLLALTVFYKRVTDPIELVIFNDNNAARFENVDRGMLVGAELEARLSFDVFHRVLNGFRLSSNLAFIYSQVSLGEFELEQKRQWDPDCATTRPLYGQSPYVLNTDLTYDIESAGFSTGLFFNIFGPRLAAVSKKAAPDIYEQPEPTLNASMSKKIGKGLSLSLSLGNLLGSQVRKTYSFKGTDYYQTRYTNGRTGSLTIGYTFK